MTCAAYPCILPPIRISNQWPVQLALAYCLPLESVTNDLCSLPLHTASYDNQLQMTSADYPCIKPSITTSNRWLLQLTLAYCFPSQSVTYDLNSLPLHAASHQNQQQMACAAYPCILPPVKQTLSEQLIPTYCLQWKSPTPNMHLLFFFFTTVFNVSHQHLTPPTCLSLPTDSHQIQEKPAHVF